MMEDAYEENFQTTLNFILIPAPITEAGIG